MKHLNENAWNRFFSLCLKSKYFPWNLFFVGLWIENIKNHYWWSLHTSTFSLDLYERFTSIVHHSINKHTWPGNQKYSKCAHERLQRTDEREIKWLRAGSPAHEELRKQILNTRLRTDLLQIGDAVHTTSLEVGKHNKNSLIINAVFLLLVSALLFKHNEYDYKQRNFYTMNI